MNESIDWLPPLVLLNDYGGDWHHYLEAIYHYFKQDFLDSKPRFQQYRFAIKRYPLIEGREATFWHLISAGKQESDRLPDLRRCERIRWPKPVIENFNEGKIKLWKNVRNRETRICLWLEEENYLVVLSERKDYVLLWTAYIVTWNHQKRNLRKEYEAYINAKAVS